MDQMEILQTDIYNLKNAYKKIQEALNLLKDVDDFSNIQYEDLDDIANDIYNLRTDKELGLERLEEF